MRKFTLLIACGTWAVLAAASWASTTDTNLAKPRCFDGRGAALKAGGFTGPLVCSREHATFTFVGTLSEAHRSYLIYYYGYRYLPEGASVMHGGHRIVVFSSVGDYLGQYALNPLPLLDVVLNHSSVTIISEGQSMGTIVFKNGPPPSAFVDGEIIDFFK